MNTLTYRVATQADLPQIVAIYNSTISSRMVTADTVAVTLESKQQWFDEHTPNHRPLWMVEDAHAATVGWVSFQSFFNGRPAYDATVEVSIYLHETQRGKGYGKQILHHCIEQAPSLGIHTLTGFIFSHNQPSLKLFKHFGFEEWGQLPNIALLDGEERSLSILGKRLG